MCSETGCSRTIINNNKLINNSSVSGKHLLQAVTPAYSLSDIKQRLLRPGPDFSFGSQPAKLPGG